jgi:excisionase family DNA binding protein
VEQHELMTVAEVASVLRVSKMTIFRAIHRGDIPAIRVGRAYRVKRSIVQDILAGGGVHA